MQDLVAKNTIKIETNEPAWLVKKRQNAFDTFISTPMPEKMCDMPVSDDFKKLNFDEIGVAGFKFQRKNAIIDEKQNDSLKRNGFVIESLDSAMKKHHEIVKNHLYHSVFCENKLSALNSALWQRSLFIYVPKNIEVSMPLQFGFYGKDKLQFDRILLVADENSRINILEHVSGNNGQQTENPENNSNTESNFRIEAVEVFLKEGSRVFYQTHQETPDSMHNFSIKKAKLEKDSELVWMDCCFGGSLSITDIFTDLSGIGSKTNILGLFYGRRSQRFGFSLKNQHTGKNTVSDMLTRGALDENAHSTYNGTVKIVEKATRSNGYQKQDVILLSPFAGADAKPNLEIDNNDVRCTHGVSIGQVDKEKLFYMMSRGLGTEEAKKKIVEGFFETVFRKVPVPELKYEAQKIVEKHLNAGLQ